MKRDPYDCPVCGQPARLALVGQAFCSNETCAVISFNPSLPDGGLSDISYVDLSDLGTGGKS